MKRTPLGRTRFQRKPKTVNRLTSVPRPAHDGEFWREQRTILALRSGYRCERCGADLHTTGLQAHHRRMRSQGGGHDIRNLVALDPACHAWVHAHPTESYLTGFLVRSTRDPYLIPIHLHTGRCVLLTEGGGYEQVKFP